jgi:hypothetical protein
MLLLADRGIQSAEAPVAVGLERAHAEFVGQGEGLEVVGLGLLSIGGISVGIDNAKLVQRVRLVSACLLLPSQVKRLAGVPPGLLAASRQPTDLTEPGDEGARPCRAPRRRLSLIPSSSSARPSSSSARPSSSSARPSARRPWSA